LSGSVFIAPYKIAKCSQKEYNLYMPTVLKKSIGKDMILDSGSVLLSENEPFETEIETSDGATFQIILCIENTGDGGPSVRSTSEGEHSVKVILSNLSDKPGSLPEPMELASNESRQAKLLLTLASKGVQDGKREVSYSILERNSSLQ
jgi:hypothetical protein